MSAHLPLTYFHSRWSLGRVLLAFGPSGLCAVLPGADLDVLLADLKKRYPHAQLTALKRSEAPARCDHVLQAIEQPGRGKSQLRLTPQGSQFQTAVWRALQAIPSGQTRSYGQVATALGRATAARAVASACAANPIAILVPCHRVLRADGGLGGYRWGLDLKQALLQRESRTAPSA